MGISGLTVIVFALCLIGIGIYYRQTTDSEAYHLAGRRAGPYQVAASLFTVLGASELVSLVALSLLVGIWSISLLAGVGCACLILAYFAPVVRQHAMEDDYHSIPDFMHGRFGKGASLIASIYSILALGSLVIIQFTVGADLISIATGISENSSLLLIAGTVSLYVLVGGFNSILVTDFIQSICMILALIAIIIFIDFDWSGGIEQIGGLIPQGANPIIDGLGLFLMGVGAALGGGDIWQRIFSAKTDRQASAGLIMSAIGFVFFSVMVFILSVAIISNYPGIDPNNAFTIFLDQNFDSLVGGTIGVLLVAAIFSTTDTQLFIISVIAEKEINRFFNRDGLSMVTTRIIIISFVAITAFLSLKVASIVDLYMTLIFFLMIMALPALAGLMQRGNRMTVVTSLILGGGILSYLIYIGQLGGLWPLLAALPGAICFIPDAKNLTKA